MNGTSNVQSFMEQYSHEKASVPAAGDEILKHSWKLVGEEADEYAVMNYFIH